ncbi:MAG TPA: S46 family peptidase [Clostridia bacterium]|nr:S46 family peptidase [Clostridia bacterium]
MRKRFLLLTALLCLLATGAIADEGMWLFNRAPKDKIKARYGFEPTQQWLDHLQLGSVRFNNGGSGSFVSANGLAFTNHHVGADCLQGVATKEKDYMKQGFYARTGAEELKCPDLELNVLEGIEDVTDQVQGAAKKGMTPAEAGQAQRALMSQLEADCSKKTGQRCDVVTLYAGGMYHLYKYKKYTDVRVVFAPEFPIAFFGGDPDNFEFPRYDLDVAFFRIYENDKPVQLKNYLRWSNTGVKENDLIFVSGHPGRTERMNTLAQLEYTRDVRLPFTLESLKRRIGVLHAFAAKSEENARIAREDIFGLENSFKAQDGQYKGLLDKQLMAKKASEEQKLRSSVEADPKKKAEFGTAWPAIEQAVKVQRELFLPSTFLENRGGFRGQLNGIARNLVRVAEEREKPNALRLREYRESNLASLEQELFSTAPIHKDLETLTFTDSLTEMRARLGADNEVVKSVLSGRTPEQVASEAIANTKLDQVNVRKQLYTGGIKAIEASTDPLIVLMRKIDPAARAIRKRMDDEVDAVLRQNYALIAKALFAERGTSMYPDATFTLRLSYGAVKGYDADGKHIPSATTMGGAYEHAAKHGNKDPYELPKSWIDAKPKLKLNTPFNFVSTADIIGGNSGSPTVNKAGEVVGIIFDGNIQSLPWNYVFDDRQGRAVHVDSRSIIESLRTIYNATELADELTGGTAKASQVVPAAKAKAATKK